MNIRYMLRRTRTLSDDESWKNELDRSGQKETEIKDLIWTLSKKTLSLRKIGVGVEGSEVTADEKAISRAILDYVIWNVEKTRLIGLADVVSTRYDFKGSKIFPVSYWKVQVMKANAGVMPTIFIYELEKECALMEDRIWWYRGTDIKGERAVLNTWHRGQLIPQENVTSKPDLWTRGLKNLVAKLI